MTFHELQEEWYDGLSAKRKREALNNLFLLLTKDIEEYDDFIQTIICDGVMAEQDDYFGTEGAKL
jgi:hypothetical protein